MKKPPRLLLTCAAVSPCAAIALAQTADPTDGSTVLAPTPSSSDGVRPIPVWRLSEKQRADTPFAMSGGSFSTVMETFSGFPLTNFSNPPGSLVSLHNQIGADGLPMGALSIVGAATDAAMMSVPPGSPGGVAPVGVLRSTGLPPGTYGVIARRSGKDPRRTGLFAAFEYQFSPRLVGIDAPLVISKDWQLLDASTFTLWQMYSSFAGVTSMRVMFGGTNQTGILSAFSDPVTDQLDRFVILGPRPASGPIGDFFSPPRSELAPFPIGQWFTLMYVSTVGPDGIPGKSIWLKSDETVAAGFLDPRLASGQIVPNDGAPLGWLNIAPGIDDDPATPQPEGIGVATNQFGQPFPALGHLGQYIDLFSSSPDQSQFRIGTDPPQSVMPGFAANDVFFDNFTASGTLFDFPPLSPDNIIPFSNDFEESQPNTSASLNQPHWSTPIPLAQTLISSPSSDTLHVNMASRTLWSSVLQRIGSANFPLVTPFPRPLPGQPTSINMRARLTSAPGVTSREILIRQSGDSTFSSFDLNEGLLPDTSAFSIVLGPVDPTDGIGAAGSQIWVRQANPAFNPALDAQDHLVERHWLPSALWTEPPAPAFNTRMTLVPTGVAFPTGRFFDIAIEIEPDPADPAVLSIIRLTVDGAPLHPFGDPARSFRAPIRTTTSVEFYSGANPGGDGDLMSVDDVIFTGPQTFLPGEAPFSLPFNEQFDGYLLDTSITRHGATNFKSRNDHTNIGFFSLTPTRTILIDPLAQPAPGELVCRYRIEATVLDSGVFTPSEIVAIPFSGISTAPPGVSTPTNCIGSITANTTFLVRAGTNQPRVESGDWRLIGESPNPFSTFPTPTEFDPELGDRTGFRFETFDAGRFSVLGAPDSTRVRRLADALPGSEGADNNALEFVANSSKDPVIVLEDTLRAILPATSSDSDTISRLTYDIYIESLNVLGVPDDTIAPRSGFSISVLSPDRFSPTTILNNRFTRINFGGPDINAGNSNPSAPVVPADNISYEMIPSTSFLAYFADTGISVLTGGVGADGVIAGPLVNRWITVIFEVDGDGNWSAAIDEDRDGPAEPVTIATGAPISSEVLPSIERIIVAEGRDAGSDGRPMPGAARIRTLPGGGAAIAPANADPTEDYCFYRVTNIETLDNSIAPSLFDPRFQSVTASINQSTTIAVLNRRTDGQGSVVGSRVHEHCPWSIGASGNIVELADSISGNIAFRGRWARAGGVGFNRFVEPIPAGGIQVVDGPSQTPPVAYTDISSIPTDSPGFAVAVQVSILLAEWADDPNDGWDPPVTFPRSRWLLDNITLSEIPITVCTGDLNGDGSVTGLDLLIILNDFGAGPNGNGGPIGNPAADINGDGVVNGVDLLLLLNNFGDCA